MDITVNLKYKSPYVVSYSAEVEIHPLFIPFHNKHSYFM